MYVVKLSSGNWGTPVICDFWPLVCQSVCVILLGLLSTACGLCKNLCVQWTLVLYTNSLGVKKVCIFNKRLFHNSLYITETRLQLTKITKYIYKESFYFGTRKITVIMRVFFIYNESPLKQSNESIRDGRVQILIWFPTFLLFTKAHFQTLNALKSTSFQAFQIISDIFSDALTPGLYSGTSL